MKQALYWLLAFVFCISGGYAFGQTQTPIDNKPEESPEISRMMQEFVDFNKTKRTIEGYRVQIYNGGKTESLKRKSQFIKSYPEIKAYIIYEYPEYRIQVGDFRDALEAERALTTIRKDFPGAFSVATSINWPQL